MANRLVTLLRPLILVAIAVATADAQDERGSVEGVVKDSSGSVLPGATVTATSEAERATAVTSGFGTYRIDLPAGVYRLEAGLPGFRTTVADAIVVRSRQRIGWSPRLGLPVSTARPVEVLVTEFIGPRARNCGRFSGSATAKAMRGAVGCALAASARRSPFVAMKQQPGTDGRIANGLIGRSDGVIFVFSYDSSPCGGSQCPEQFLVTPCRSPAVRDDSPGVWFVCN